MAKITITDTDGNTVEWTGLWVHKKSGFSVDREKCNANQVALLADRAIGHMMSNESNSKYNALEKKGEATVADRDRIVGEAREEYRAALYDGSWGSGARISRAAPEDRVTQLFKIDVARRVREIVNASLTKQGKDMWLDGDGNAFGLDAWMDNYLGNDDPEPTDTTKTVGEYRRERHMAEAQAQYAEEVRKLAARAETRKITGTKI